MINISSGNLLATVVKNNTIPEVSQVQELNQNKFSDFMENAINKLNETQVKSDNNIEALIKGEDVSMHEVMLSIQEAQMSMQLALEVRNKMYDAYQELNRVQM